MTDDHAPDAPPTGDPAPTAEVAEVGSTGGRPDVRMPEDERRPRLALILVPLVALAAVSVALAALGWSEASDANAELDDAAAARRVAAEFGEAYLSFDTDDVDGATDRLLTLATETFADEFESTRAPSIEELFAAGDTVTRASVQDVFAGEVTGDRARALVVVDIDASGPEGRQRLVGLSFVLEMVREDSRWLVDAVGPAPFPEVVGGPDGDPPTAPDPSSPTPSTTTTPTSTTVPAPTSAPAG
ncbi:MAG TPA: hypothetical protein VFV42_10660 [Acidimicrobiales bacterium]|nr:hypothetical protein [Acidimicrobiales bacterium]